MDSDSIAQIDEGARVFTAKHGKGRTPVGSHAAFAVGVSVLLLVALLVWIFLGRAGTFPNEALKIAATGAKAAPNQFDAVEEKASELQDWFALKGFDNFQVPAEFDGFDVVGVRRSTVVDQPIAQALVPENVMYFYCFASSAVRNQHRAGGELAHHGGGSIRSRYPRGERHVFSHCLSRFEARDEGSIAKNRCLPLDVLVVTNLRLRSA